MNENISTPQLPPSEPTDSAIESFIKILENTKPEQPMVVIGLSEEAQSRIMAKIAALTKLGSKIPSVVFAKNKAELPKILEKKFPFILQEGLMTEAIDKINILQTLPEAPEVYLDEKEFSPWHRKSKMLWEKRHKKKGHQK